MLRLMGSQRVGHNGATDLISELTSQATHFVPSALLNMSVKKLVLKSLSLSNEL